MEENKKICPITKEDCLYKDCVFYGPLRTTLRAELGCRIVEKSHGEIVVLKDAYYEHMMYCKKYVDRCQHIIKALDL